MLLRSNTYSVLQIQGDAMNEEQKQTDNHSTKPDPEQGREHATTNGLDQASTPRAGTQHSTNRSLRIIAYWCNLIVQPIIAVIAIIGLVFLFGYAQKNYHWFTHAKTSASDEAAEVDSMFACSMLCVFLKAPGRCPVCGMELQEIESKGDPKDLFGVTITPTARRLSNIKTVAALNMPLASQSDALGQITYDETTVAMVSAYVDGRIEDMMVDFTGATIRQGDELAVIYSPDLYADQVGLLQARKAARIRSSYDRVNRANERLYQSARRRLVEFGLTEDQVDTIEASGSPDSRIKIYSPASGTVVKKMTDKGKYVKTGMPILKLADLSNVWLMLEVYPEDATNLKINQPVDVTIQSQVGKTFVGKISFVDPMVDPKTQTVKVRVVIPNEAGLIKIGDFAKAKIQSTVDRADSLVMVPRESVLMNGSNSVAYVETEPGRFEFRKVEIAKVMKDKVSIASGIEPGEQVVSSGVFMLDSTFNIQGKVSLIDPNQADSKNESQLAIAEAEAIEIERAFAELSPADRELAESQVICPVTEVKLGTLGMGTPIRVKLDQQDVLICCEGCRSALVESPTKYLNILAKYKSEHQNHSNDSLLEMKLP